VTKDSGSVVLLVVVDLKAVRCVPLWLVRFCKLKLNSINTVDTIDEEDQDKDKCDLHSIL
jgi:hypothetical protein